MSSLSGHVEGLGGGTLELARSVEGRGQTGWGPMDVVVVVVVVVVVFGAVVVVVVVVAVVVVVVLSGSRVAEPDTQREHRPSASVQASISRTSVRVPSNRTPSIHSHATRGSIGVTSVPACMGSLHCLLLHTELVLADGGTVVASSLTQASGDRIWILCAT